MDDSQGIAGRGEFFFHGGRDGVLMIHGLAGSPKEMHCVGRSLQRAGYSVLCMRIAGHGGTEAELIASDRHAWWTSVLDAFRRLAGRCDRVFAAGLSMGALLALKLAITYPDEISGLALYSSILRYDGWAMPRWSRLSGLLPYALALGLGHGQRFMERPPYGIKDPRIRERVVGRMLGGERSRVELAGPPSPSIAEFLALSREVRGTLDRVVAPTLLIHAADDDTASISNSLDIVAGVSAPIELLVLYDSYHSITVDAERAKVSATTARLFGYAKRTPSGLIQRYDCRPTISLSTVGDPGLVQNIGALRS